MKDELYTPSFMGYISEDSRKSRDMALTGKLRRGACPDSGEDLFLFIRICRGKDD